jgi:hypothetical protein
LGENGGQTTVTNEATRITFEEREREEKERKEEEKWVTPVNTAHQSRQCVWRDLVASTALARLVDTRRITYGPPVPSNELA